MLANGFAPSIGELIQKGFENQKKFIEQQFEDQRGKMIGLMKQEGEAVNIVETEFDQLKLQTLGMIESLETRFDFMNYFKGMEGCLQDPLASEIMNHIEYFLEQANISKLKNIFTSRCAPLLFTQVINFDSCFFLLNTFLTIETKKHVIIMIMINLLSDSKNLNQLTDGYLDLESVYRLENRDWLLKILHQDHYCEIMKHYGIMDTNQGEQIKQTAQFFDFPVQEMDIQCDRKSHLSGRYSWITSKANKDFYLTLIVGRNALI